LSTDDQLPADPANLAAGGGNGEGNGDVGRLIKQSIEDELKESYLTYAMSVIVSLLLLDVRAGLYTSQPRIPLSMNNFI
jgi:DNA gyrase subunit A